MHNEMESSNYLTINLKVKKAQDIENPLNKSESNLK